MLEEFRRRSNLKDYYDLMKKKRKETNPTDVLQTSFEMSQENLDKSQEFRSSGPERFFENKGEEVFDTSQFTLIFIDSDSVTNVTSLNRVNHRRVLIFIGNGNGLISFGKGKSEDYEGAFEQAFKKLRQNLVCLNLEQSWTTPINLQGAHNDVRIKIFPQHTPNYWGSPLIWHLLLNTGFFHCRFTCKSRKREPYSMMYAYFNCVTPNKTPTMIT